jgi:hypothetical protein
MKTLLEFANASGNETVADNIEAYEGPLPATGDTIYLDLGAKYRVVRRVFYYSPESPGTLHNFRREMKVSLHCEKLEER